MTAGSEAAIGSDERDAIGSLLAGSVEIADVVAPEDLADPFSRAVLNAYLQSHGKGETPDPARIAEAVGCTVADLAELITCESTPGLALHAARAIHRRASGFRLARVLQNTSERLAEGKGSAQAVEKAARALEGYASGLAAGPEQTNIRAILREHADAILAPRENAGERSGLAALDRCIGGLQPGELVEVAARPKRGKSAFMLSVLAAASVPAVLFSLEMTARECARRLCTIIGRIPSDEMAERGADMVAAMDKLHGRQLDIVDTAGLNVSDIAGEVYARRWARIVAVDYAQIMGRVRGAKDSRESLVESVKALKNLAKLTGTTVLLGTQINREGDEHPSARCLAESDELLRSADAVLVLDWKPEAEEPETRFFRNPVNVRCHVTQRHGPAASFDLAFFRSRGQFADVTGEDGGF